MGESRPAGPALWQACVAEVLGTFILVFFGCGAVFVAVLTGALAGLLQVAIVWGLAIALAIHAVSAISGSHINPAVTAAMCVYRRFPVGWVLPYFLAQFVGAFLAAALLYALFGNVMTAFERDAGLVRGEAGSQLTAMCFCDYFPNPEIVGTDAAALSKVTYWQALLGEIIGTALLVFAVFALTDKANRNRPDGTLPAIFIGLTVSIIVVVLGPLTMAGLNPARDFGPRLFAWLAGWGPIAIPGPRGEFLLVYIVAPFVGGIAGGGTYALGIGRMQPVTEAQTAE